MTNIKPPEGQCSDCSPVKRRPIQSNLIEAPTKDRRPLCRKCYDTAARKLRTQNDGTNL